MEFSNRLETVQTRDLVFKIKIKKAICELQLAMKQDSSQYHLEHSIYEIIRSPLGCIFGCYIYKAKGVHYPLVANCFDLMKMKESS